MANLKPQARRLKQAGRYGDTQLVHMSMDEYMALQAMGKLTKNPETGLPEAFNLGDFLGDSFNFGREALGVIDPFASGVDPLGGQLSAAQAVDQRGADAFNYFSSEPSIFDYTGAGTVFAEDPEVRRVGRGVGLAFGGAALGSALGGGAGTGATAGGGESAFAGEALGASAGGEIGAGVGGGAGSAGAGAGAEIGASAGALAPGGIFDPGVTSMQGSQGGEAGPGGPGGATFGAQPMSLFDRIINSAFGTPGAAFKTGSNIVGIGSEIYNLLQQRKMQKMARQAFTSTKELQANPGMVTGLPGYQFGLDEGRRAIERRGAASGSGGNEAIALARYTPEYAQQFYDREFARRANLDQAQAQLDFNANTSANRGTAQSVGNIGFALARIFG